VLIALVLMCVSNLGFALLAAAGHSNLGMAAAIGFENFASGYGGVVVVAYLSALCNLRYTAAQYALVSAAATALSITDGEVLRWFGQRAIPVMAKRWPEFFAPHRNSLPFLSSLNDVIHPEVRKLYSGAFCPHFDFAAPTENELTIGYRSPRKLCELAHGFIIGAGEHYGETLAVQHSECMHAGSDRCLIAVTAA
jgi:hypothetical protein